MKGLSVLWTGMTVELIPIPSDILASMEGRPNMDTIGGGVRIIDIQLKIEPEIHQIWNFFITLCNLDYRRQIGHY